MDSLINPYAFSLIPKIASHYLSDIERLKNYDLDEINKYRNKSFLKLIKYANNVPLYNKKFKDAKINPRNINGIEDIANFSIINREDVIKNFPTGLIAPGFEKHSIIVSTSGSTRNPVSLYLDQFILIKALIIYARELKNYGIKWNKSRISIIANFYSDTAPTKYFSTGAFPTLKFAFSMKNIQQINCDDELMSICKKIDEFRPECIIGFPGPLRHLALLNQKGYGKNINPKCIISTGGLLDNFEKKYIKEVFHTKVFDIYASNEAGPISFECKEGNYHIHSDIQYLEVIDSKGNLKDIGKKGILAITRTYGHGTPIIRYTGMDDIVQLKEGECSCGLNTELMEPVHGRIKESIVLPDGRIIYPRKLMDLVGDAVKNLKTNKIQFLQIVQKSLDKIEVLVVIDEDKRHKDESVELFLGEVGKSYQQYFGPEVRFEIKEVKKLRTEENRPDSMPGVLSKIDVKKHIV